MRYTSRTTRKKNWEGIICGGILGVLVASSLVVGPAASADERERLTPFESSLAVLTGVEAPVIDPSYHQGWDRVTGTISEDVKKVRLYDGDRYVRTGQIQNGRFAIYTRDVHPRAGEDWEVVPFGADGRPGQVAPLDASLSMAAVTAVDDHAEGDTYLTGKTAGADAIRLYVDRKEKRAVKVSDDGTFKLYVLDLGLKEGMDLEVVALDEKRREGVSSAQSTSRLDLAVVDMPVYYQGQDRVTGTVTEDVNKVRIYRGDTYIRTSPVTNGAFTIYVRDMHPRVGEKWSIVPVGRGNRQGPAMHWRPALPDDVRIVEIDYDYYCEYSDLGRFAYGQAVGSTEIRHYSDGKEMYTAPVGADGSFKIEKDCPSERRDSDLTFHVFDAHGRSTPELDFVHTYGLGEEYLMGRATTGAAGVRLYIDGVEQRGAKVVPGETDLYRNFKLYVKDLDIREGTSLELFPVDDRGREGEAMTVTPVESNLHIHNIYGFQGSLDPVGRFTAKGGPGTHGLVVKDENGDIVARVFEEFPPVTKRKYQPYFDKELVYDRSKVDSRKYYDVFPLDYRGREGALSGKVQFSYDNGCVFCEVYLPAR